MADIPIERKDHRSIWPWIIGIIVLLLILWFLFGRHRNGNAAMTTGADTTTMMAPAATAPGAPAGSTAGTGAAVTPGTPGTTGTTPTTPPTGTRKP